MTKHSKNSTASGIFSYHERQNVEFGTKRARVGKDSTKDFDSCCLCLKQAESPQSCLGGHVYCRECILECIVTQKQDYAKAKKAHDAQMASKAAQAQNDAIAKEEQKLDKFEQIEGSILPQDVKVFQKRGSDAVAAEDERSAKKAKAYSNRADNLLTARGDTFKFGDAGSNLDVKAFWIASHTPTAAEVELKAPSSDLICPEGQHTMKAKSLISLQFTELRDATKGSKDRYMCPSCLKTLTNAPKLVTFRGCGHVMCQNCFDKFVKKTGQCFVCERKLKQKDIVALQAGGTGFSSHGEKLKAEKYAPSQRL